MGISFLTNQYDGVTERFNTAHVEDGLLLPYKKSSHVLFLGVQSDLQFLSLAAIFVDVTLW